MIESVLRLESRLDATGHLAFPRRSQQAGPSLWTAERASGP